MSCMEAKTVIRIMIPELEGATYTQAYEYFKNILGEAEDLDVDDGKIEYFRYTGTIQPVYSYTAKRWGIDYVLHHSSDHTNYIGKNFDGLTLSDFEKIASDLSLKFNLNKNNAKLKSYSWYNGGDEPIKF